ncbi:MAG: DUF1566 domain-containing protein [Calditrichaeota bacterium]|nr:MAG: DUF1566 domain-containing protein [Calditrichota bacterium]
MGIERKHDKLCFVIMPFDEQIKKVYTDAIKPACVQAQMDVLRADELIGPYNIHRDIIQYIFNSDVVIADLTDWNPNVFYEMGVVHAIDNKTILINEIKNKSAEIEKLKKQLSEYKQPKAQQKRGVQNRAVLSLRSQAIDKLSEDEVQQMLAKNNFYDSGKNESGSGIQHQYEKQYSGKVVFDGATGLYWQQSGSSKTINYKNAEKYVEQLNRNNFAGFSDWRLPTLEEAMSLMESTQKRSDLFVDPVFENTQQHFWTMDKSSAGDVWVVGFSGGCGDFDVYGSSYVRAVRL